MSGTQPVLEMGQKNEAKHLDRQHSQLVTAPFPKIAAGAGFVAPAI
jgi:hypothetical protein